MTFGSGGGAYDIDCILQLNLLDFGEGLDILAFGDIWQGLGRW
jgi:hypothetical protein